MVQRKNECRRVAVRIAYRGDTFHGSQRQPGLRTVESDILRSLSIISPPDSPDAELKTASRTDAGVSAAANVVAFWTSFDDDASLLRALNATSSDVHFLAICGIGEGRNIRYASSRSYRYLMPLEGVDVEAVKSSARLFEGRHDFKNFCKDDGKDTVETIDRIEVGHGDVICIDIHGRRFLWNMVRRIVAALEEVGRGRATMQDVRMALEGGGFQFGLADPRPLTLRSVDYSDLEFRSFDDPVLRRKLMAAVHKARTDLEFHRDLL